MKNIAVIPARYSSTRFPGKLMELLGEKTVIQTTYDNTWEQTNLEKIEKLEQLRYLENGVKIKMILTDHASIGIDTPDDLELARQYLSQQKKLQA